MCYVRSRVPIPIHIDETEVESDLAPNLQEPPMGLMVIFDDVSVRSVAEGRIGGVLAVAELVVSAFVDVEADRSASSDTRVA